MAEARTRLERALPNAPAQPALRDVQHALARDMDCRVGLHSRISLLLPSHTEKTATRSSTGFSRTRVRIITFAAGPPTGWPEIDSMFNLTDEEFHVGEHLVVIGPLPSDDLVGPLVEYLESKGLIYFDNPKIS